MSTISYRRGSTAPFFVRLTQPDGTPPDPTGLAVQIRVPSSGACLPLDGTAVDGGWSFDLSTLDLSPRVYRAAIWLRDATGWRHGQDITLDIQGGC